MPDEERGCSVCGAKMVRRFGHVMTSYPPQFPYDWWCGCGNVEPGGIVYGKTQEELLRAEWERKNA